MPTVDFDLHAGKNLEFHMEKADMVNSPPHYNQNGIECIDYIEQNLGPIGFRNYCKGNFMKYVHRSAYKGKELEDMKKARWYIDRWIKSKEEET